MFLNYIYIFILTIMVNSLIILSLYVSNPINIFHAILLIISIGLISYLFSEKIILFLIKEIDINN